MSSLDEAEAILASAITRSAKLSAPARALDVRDGGSRHRRTPSASRATTPGVLAQVFLAVIVLVRLLRGHRRAISPPPRNWFAAAERICALLSEEEPAPTHEIPQGESVIEARDLAIGWPGGPTLATGISFTLRPGSSFVVGASGIGKHHAVGNHRRHPPKSGQAPLTASRLGS